MGKSALSFLIATILKVKKSTGVVLGIMGKIALWTFCAWIWKKILADDLNRAKFTFEL